MRWIAAGDLAAMLLALAVTLAVAQAVAAPAVLGAPALAVALALAQGPFWLVLFAAHRLYERQTRAISTSALDELPTLFHALLVGCLTLLLGSQVLSRTTGTSLLTPIEAGLLLPVALVLVPLGRALVRGALLPALAPARRTVVVGTGADGLAVAARLARRPALGMQLVGFVDDGTSPADAPPPASGPLLGGPEDLTRIVEEHRIDWVVVACSHAPHRAVLDAVRAVRRPDVHLSIVPHYYEVFASNAELEDVEGLPLISLPPMGLSRSAAATKRALDVLVAGGALVLLAPLLGLFALAIRLGSPGPALFRQPRRGRDGTTFTIFKLRTMVLGAEARREEVLVLNEADGPLLKIRADPRRPSCRAAVSGDQPGRSWPRRCSAYQPAAAVPMHRAAELSPSDQWTPMAAPSRPTVKPLPARRPLADTP